MGGVSGLCVKSLGLRGCGLLGFRLRVVYTPVLGLGFFGGVGFVGQSLATLPRFQRTSFGKFRRVFWAVQSLYGAYIIVFIVSPSFHAVLRGLEGGFWDFGFMEIQGPKELPILLWGFLIISMI